MAAMGSVPATGLVIETADPLDNKVRMGKKYKGTVRVLADADGAPIYAGGRFDLSEKRWLVVGQEIPLSMDPASPEDFEIDWDAIPSMEERAAANDPTLADPIGASRKAREALAASGVAEGDLNSYGTGVAETVAQYRAADAAARAGATPDHFQQAMDAASQQSPQPGKTRAVALLAATTATLQQDDAQSGSPRDRLVTSGKRKAVLSVNVPGQAPYAVFQPKFKRPRLSADLTGAGLPALVSASDPSDVEILWDELASLDSQLSQRIADSGSQAAAASPESQMMDTIQKAMSGPPPAMPSGGVPKAPAGGMPDLNPQMQAMIAQNAKQALSMITDPAQRKMMIEQYRSMGIEVDDE